MTEVDGVVPLNPYLLGFQERLAEFLVRHPQSSVKERRNAVIVDRPWGDPTLTLDLDEESDALMDALNIVLLPPRLTAIWHTDTRDLEVIYTALPIPPELRKRSFEFQRAGNSYRCEFAKSSERLMVIAAASRPVAPPSETAHRNLESYYMFEHLQREHSDAWEVQDGGPVSFYVRGVPYEDEDSLIQFIRELNFIMAYADPGTPTVMVHAAQGSGANHLARPYAPVTDFPECLRAPRIDSYLLSLWESSANSRDPFRRFIYLFQILEYCAFYHVQDEILRVIGRAVQAPDASSRVSEIAREILEAFSEDRTQETQKFLNVIERCVNPSRVWSVIEPNLSHFAHDHKLDGGFTLPSLVREGWALGDFRQAWLPKFAHSLRQIRNALVHAREPRQVGVIAPTQENYEKLAPWLFPLEVAATEAVIFSSLDSWSALPVDVGAAAP